MFDMLSLTRENYTSMKLVIVGATGATGLCLVQQAVDAGHDVTAVMRNTDNFPIQHENLKVVKGSIYSVDSLSEHFQGCDAVMSCLGTKTLRNVKLYSESAKFIFDAMRQANVSRFIVMTSWCTSVNRQDRGPFMMEWIYKGTFLRSLLKDMARMEKYIEESCSDINYSVVRPPQLGDGSVTDKEFHTAFDRFYVPGAGYPKISRADVARFMLLCLTTDKYDKKMVAIRV
ncbi:flavin reductase (NADPH)-like isoform X2 [Apostichopus japonicus]|uniref:flavin reductase (NADPH)-like isoform X2 n=1 Tax=Stichopus japonicus TaxID=307972 RepID=UPI003AB55D41